MCRRRRPLASSRKNLLPLFFASRRRRSHVNLFCSSFTVEPVGALLAWFILMPFLNDVVFGFIFSAVAGIMVFISIDELLPTAREYGLHHHAVYGFMAGMAVMALSLLLFI